MLEIMEMYYHLTETENIPRILCEGLLPMIGPRSSEFGEDVPRVYLFGSITDVKNAGWLIDSFESDDLSVVEVQIPKESSSEVCIRKGAAEFEWYAETKIPPKFIRSTREI